MVAGWQPDRIRLQSGESELSNLYDASRWWRGSARRCYGRTWHRPEVVARWKNNLLHHMREVRVQRRLSDLRGETRCVFRALAPRQPSVLYPAPECCYFAGDGYAPTLYLVPLGNPVQVLARHTQLRSAP